MHNWIGVVFLICSFTSSVLCCDWLRHYGHHSNNSLVLLDQMGGQLTEQESPVSFPYSFYQHMREIKVESRLVFIRDSLELIGGLYLHGNLSSVTWDTTKIEHFLLSIYRQTDGLNSCVSTNRKPDKQTRKLKRYYRKLSRNTVEIMGSSTASWELIRKETKHHLQQLDLLVANIRRSAASNSRRSASSLHLI